MRKILALCLAGAVFGAAHAGVSNETGVIFDHTSIQGALLIRFDPALTPLPGNCASASSNWMYIPETNKAMMAVALLAIASDNRLMTIYTKGINSSNYCEVTQVDPSR